MNNEPLMPPNPPAFHDNQPGVNAPPKTSGGAITSLVLGILSVCCLSIVAGIPAVICGHISYGNIRKSGGQMKGAGMAVAGLILGYFSILLLPILAAIMFPAFTAAKHQAEVNGMSNDGRQVFVQIMFAAEGPGGSQSEGFLFMVPGKFKTSTAYFDALVEQGVLNNYDALKDEEGRLLWSVVESDGSEGPMTPFMVSANVNQAALDQPFADGRIKDRFPSPTVITISRSGVVTQLKRKQITVQAFNPEGATSPILHP